MLVFTRLVGEKIVIDDGRIEVMVVSVKGGRVRLGTTAPAGVTVDRGEVHERKTAKTADAMQ